MYRNRAIYIQHRHMVFKFNRRLSSTAACQIAELCLHLNYHILQLSEIQQQNV